VPVVSTGQGGLAEYMEDGVNALLVPPSSPETMARAITRILDDARLAEHLVQNGRLIAPVYDVERCVRAVLGLYRELVEAQA
jgi:glycosyltransferase involved in cell wall biosynthesis